MKRRTGVYASGFAHFEVMNTCGSAAFSFQSGLRKITADEVDRLKTIVANAKVESLPARIEPPANLVTTEETVLGLRVWIKGEMREIIAYGVDRAENQDAVRRFQSVRQAVEKLGSAPR